MVDGTQQMTPDLAVCENDFSGRTPAAKEAFASCMGMALAKLNVEQAAALGGSITQADAGYIGGGAARGAEGLTV